MSDCWALLETAQKFVAIGPADVSSARAFRRKSAKRFLAKEKRQQEFRAFLRFINRDKCSRAFQRLQTSRGSAGYDPARYFSPDQARELILKAKFVLDELTKASKAALRVIIAEWVLRTKQRQVS